MPSTYSSSLRLELIATGEQQGSWGSTTNVNLGTLIEQAVCGYQSITVSDVADTTLTTVNGNSDQARNMVLNLIGTISATRNVICPSAQKLYVVKNATTGGFAVTFKVSGQTGVTIPNGAIVYVYVDGTDVRSITGTMASQNSNNVSITGGTITGITDLAVADGGTGASDAANARTNLGLVIGTNVQAYDATLQSLSALGTTANRIAYTTGVDTWAESTITAAGRAILDDADAAAQRTTLGLGNLSTLNTVGTSQIDDNSVTGAKIALGSDAQGDVMYYNGTDWVRLAAGSSGQALITSGSGANPAWGSSLVTNVVSTTSGTSVDFTSIPSWANRITVVLSGVSTTGTSPLVLRVGTSSGFEATGYICLFFEYAESSYSSSTTGFNIQTTNSAAATAFGTYTLTRVTGNTWTFSGMTGEDGGTDRICFSTGTKSLSGALDRVRLTTALGTATFDAGTMNIIYE